MRDFFVVDIEVEIVVSLFLPPQPKILYGIGEDCRNNISQRNVISFFSNVIAFSTFLFICYCS